MAFVYQRDNPAGHEESGSTAPVAAGFAFAATRAHENHYK
jgi:hypothetical protein